MALPDGVDLASITDLPIDLSQLKAGTIVRRSRLHEQFGGQQQGGISTPSRFPIVILFTGASGSQHGYDDGWSDGIFCYFGEGQVGDMPWARGNVAIRDHAVNVRDLFLFEILKEPRSHVRFIGGFNASSWEYRSAPDREGHQRQSIVFHLIPADTIDAWEGFGATIVTDLQPLRQAAYDAGSATPAQSVREARQSYIERSATVRAYALSRADGVCEACSITAPFITNSGRPYLEVHHIHRLADGGPDRPDAVAAICPNCHRAAHFSRDGKSLNDRLKAIIQSKEHAAGSISG